MRITYRTLQAILSNLSEEQLDSDVTVELFDGESTECFPAHLRICGSNHDTLDENHPVIYLDTTQGDTERLQFEAAAEKIGPYIYEIDYQPQGGWYVVRSTGRHFDYQYLHKDLQWRSSTEYLNKFSGYFESEEEAKQALQTYRSQS